MAPHRIREFRNSRSLPRLIAWMAVFAYAWITRGIFGWMLHVRRVQDFGMRVSVCIASLETMRNSKSPKIPRDWLAWLFSFPTGNRSLRFRAYEIPLGLQLV